MEPKYPMHTLPQARASLAQLISDHTASRLSVMEYRAIRDVLQDKIKQFEAKRKDEDE